MNPLELLVPGEGERKWEGDGDGDRGWGRESVSQDFVFPHILCFPDCIFHFLAPAPPITLAENQQAG